MRLWLGAMLSVGRRGEDAVSAYHSALFHAIDNVYS